MPELTTSEQSPLEAEVEVETPKWFRRLMRRLWVLLRLALVVAAVAAVAYYGWPFVMSQVIQPIADNSQQIGASSARLDAMQSQIDEIAANMTSGVEANQRLGDVEAAVAEAGTASGAMSQQLEDLDGAIQSQSARLDELSAAQLALETGATEAEASAWREIELLRSMELLSRARLFLYQANYGLAASDVSAAQNVILGVQERFPQWSPGVLVEVEFRLGRTLEALPSRPVLAADDLDIAWQVLLTRRLTPAELETVDAGTQP